jgi:hypothetical protein
MKGRGTAGQPESVNPSYHLYQGSCQMWVQMFCSCDFAVLTLWVLPFFEKKSWVKVRAFLAVDVRDAPAAAAATAAAAAAAAVTC